MGSCPYTIAEAISDDTILTSQTSGVFEDSCIRWHHIYPTVDTCHIVDYHTEHVITGSVGIVGAHV